MTKNGTKNRKNSDRNNILHSGLSYIKNQRNYLIINALIPAYCILVQIINLTITFSSILNVNEILPEFRRPRTPVFLIDALTPTFLFLVFSIFLILNFIFLVRWKKKVQKYENQQKDYSHSNGNVTLTQLFYDIVNIMEKLKITFIAINLLYIFYLQWFFRFFLLQIHNRQPPIPPEMDIFHSIIMQWPNMFLQILLLIYLVMNWRHFIRWNKKLAKLKEFEQQIYKEIDFEGKLLLIYGDEQELEEAKEMLTSKKTKVLMKNAQILDKEEFEQRFRDIIIESESE